MRSKIVTIEDITKIVGISNYVEALKLDKNKLLYHSYEPFGNKIKVYFSYEDLPITILINKEYRMVNMDCGCKPGLDYCPHIAQAIMYLVEHEQQVEEMISILTNEYDASFNHKLWNLYAPNHSKKIITLDVILKKIDTKMNDSYELQIKIGDQKKYVLKKQLEPFLYIYQEQKGEIEFGPNFYYRYEDYTFDEIDKKIIDFLAFYVDSQNSTIKTFYGYHTLESKLDSIRLTKESLLQFMKLLEQKSFTVEIGYYACHFNGIQNEFPLTMSLESKGQNLNWKINQTSVIPLISTYEYVMVKDHMYHVQTYPILKLLLEQKKQEVIIKQEEMPLFMKYIYPNIEEKTTIDLFLQNKILSILPTVKYYFEKKDVNIIATIMLCYQEQEKNLFEDSNEWNGIYLKRDEKLEKVYQNELFKRGFVLQNQNFILQNSEEIVLFLEQGLKELTKQYEVYISSELKNMKILHHVSLKGHFSLGKDKLLSYQFQIEHMSEEEIQDFLKSLRYKRKYYLLKDGNYIDLQNSNVASFSSLIEKLEIGDTKGEIPLYKGLLLHPNEFVKLDDSLKQFLENFRSYKNLEINWDPHSVAILRDYQKIGVQWMIMISKCGFSGILADEMGLGKSLQTIEYIKYKLQEKGMMLLIVPTSLIYNWEHEFQQFGKNIRYCIINDVKAKRISYFEHLEEYDVIITTYGMIRQDIDYYRPYIFDTCIIDEAQNIKNANTETTKMIKQIKSKTRFALTGTPIENSIMELWSIFDFLMPGFLSNSKQFKEKYHIKLMEEDSALLSQLNDQISPFILRRKKKDVLKELPNKIENNIYIDLTEEQKKLYFAVLEQTKQKIQTTLQQDGFQKSKILILSLLTRLRQICIDPRLYIETDMKSGKLEELLQIIKTMIQNHHKMLLFSQFPSALKLVQKELQENNISSYYLDGATPSKTRMYLVDAFNRDDTNIFLISLKAGGTGLNLTSADVVIHLDLWWNPQVENQATDRSHRIGQKHVVEVIRLIAKGTIEEKILELQQKKRNLCEQVIEGETRDQMILSKLTEEELLSILGN